MAFAEIIEETRARVKRDQESFPLQRVMDEPEFELTAANFDDAFPVGEVNLITEIKYGSPSRGKIFDADVISPVDVARAYVENGSRAISILTEPTYFHGSYDYLRSVRSAYPEIPIIMKDFVIDPYQVHFARFIGASVVLLCVRYLDEVEIKDLQQLAVSIGLNTLVEVHDEAELEIACRIGCKVMGVNNRNLKTLDIDLDVGRNLAPHFPDDVVKICESGIFERSQIDDFRELGFDGFLVGTSLMMDGRPGKALHELISG